MVNSFINDGEAAVKESEKKAGLGADALANLQVRLIARGMEGERSRKGGRKRGAEREGDS